LFLKKKNNNSDQFELGQIRKQLVKSSNERLQEIKSFANEFATRKEVQQDLADWGMSVSQKLETVKAYELEPEGIHFGSHHHVAVNGGTYRYWFFFWH